ncbi:TetR/AcrR family transcriptional regulator [Xenorhabdus bovienii]|uniref:TetR/AcrR family transcriptional regulator n=1 Tax=Xenorhabdus bovienii TaxID=40576 RepID=UPI00237D0809|nr:TetR/AcrR family transcriptional regulator [Xenorhabdus bovienii]MDE1487800.1 TetR/AcrR family transcriptional regulator [Xenorhabdus bovienii]MDE1494787.1 TetR/AcrR family transcriptional regulator [Xenorhabdus bovienii]MDE9474454.1 TetR/AcrR family transcriptional regulator [Xenorhabdus bovienii]MDE9478697.1 TetR/AcrR family transcriptional regulator [Xenorhabdus bovienii]MDE9531520.1 TetR/AcrR family transcriptional regulator [Xenorhabdus bovienii]
MVRKRVPEQHESKRQEILAAAHHCFLRNGLQGASISMICKEAAMSPGHLYHYFPSKDAIIEQMADDYLSKLHAHFSCHAEGEQTATVLLSELWIMKGWGDLSHCRILFELLAEAGRNERIRSILKENTDGVRELLSATLKAGQSRGEVDPELDPQHTSAVLVAILDAAPMLPLMTSDINFDESRKLITTMVSRFLQPSQ